MVRTARDAQSQRTELSGSIQITSSDYKMKFLARGSEESGQWQRFSKLHVADGTEYYFYIRNNYMGDEGAVLYDDLSIRLMDDAPAATAEKFEPGMTRTQNSVPVLPCLVVHRQQSLK